MRSSPTILFALTGDVRRNSRALRQLRVLAAEGYGLHVLTLGPPLAPMSSSLVEGMTLQVVPTPEGSGPRYFARVHQTVARVARQVTARVYHASDLYVLPALAGAARQHQGRLVYDARERYPHVAATVGRPWVRRFWQAVEGRYVRRADAVFTVSPSIAQHMAATYGIVPPTVLYNTPPQQTVVPSGTLRARAGVLEGDVLILHQGQLRPDRGTLPLVRAMAHVSSASLVFLGDGPLQPRLAAEAGRLGLTDRVHFAPPVPPDDLLPLTADADIGVTLLEDTCLNHRFALPNKLFEYLMAGVPVIGSDLPEVRRVIVGHQVGAVANPADPSGLAQVLQQAVDDAALRRQWAAHIPQVFETFSWDLASQALQERYDQLLRG